MLSSRVGHCYITCIVLVNCQTSKQFHNFCQDICALMNEKQFKYKSIPRNSNDNNSLNGKKRSENIRNNFQWKLNERFYYMIVNELIRSFNIINVLLVLSFH